MTTQSIKSILRPCSGCGIPFESGSASFSLLGTSITLQETYCPDCRVVEEETLRRVSAHPEAKARKSWAEICPPAYLGFDLNLLPEASRSVAVSFLRWIPSPRGVGLVGESRRGKTFLLHELARLQHEAGRSIHLVTGTGFAYAVGAPESEERRRMLNSCIKCYALFFDDLDKMKITDRVESDLFHVIEERRRWLRPIFATLNSRGGDLEAMLRETTAKPIVNRLRMDVCRFLAI